MDGMVENGAGGGQIVPKPTRVASEARLVLAIMKIRKLPREVKTVVIRVENASACALNNMGQALSPKMRRTLRIMVIIQKTYCLQVVARHVRTEDKFVADWLRRTNTGRYRIIL